MKSFLAAALWFIQDIDTLCGLVLRHHSKNDIQSVLQSTPQGICMYALPYHFNLGLLDSTFHQPEPQPKNISPSDGPPLEGMFDTMQFSLERIFYDRMVAAATEQRLATE